MHEQPSLIPVIHRDSVPDYVEENPMRTDLPRFTWKNGREWKFSDFYLWQLLLYTEDRDKWRKYVHGVANPRIKDG